MKKRKMLAVYVMSFSFIQSERLSRKFNAIQVSGGKNQAGELSLQVQPCLSTCSPVHTCPISLSASEKEKINNTPLKNDRLNQNAVFG